MELGGERGAALVESRGADGEAGDDHDGRQDAAQLPARALLGEVLDAPLLEAVSHGCQRGERRVVRVGGRKRKGKRGKGKGAMPFRGALGL